ncbi:MAG TPA: SurA N-terminal domain-containing protein [Candidatus Kapabacteria bacterium]
MPLMTKMRDSMPVVFAGLAGIFLLMIIFEWGGQGTIFSPNGQNGVLATVNGFKITQDVYNKILTTSTDQMKTKNKESELTESEQSDAENNAWDQAISQALIDQGIDKMGISVTDQEIRDVLFSNPPADVKQAFTDSTGQFHQDSYLKFLRDPKYDSIVRLMEGDARQEIRNMKWQQYMASTCRVTDSEAFIRYLTDSAKAIVSVIKIAPQGGTPSGAQVSDQEIKAYYDAHTWLYPQDEKRKFQFVAFPLVPNSRDTAMALETANTIKSKLAEAAQNDVDTVAKELSQDYSDQPFIPSRLVNMRELGNDTSLTDVKTGDVAIVHISGKLTVVRIMADVDTLGLTLFKLRHIVLEPRTAMPVSSQEQKDSLMRAGNQILDELHGGANFAEVARSQSMDPRSAIAGGEMGWMDTGLFPPVFRRNIALAKPGDIVGPFESQQGVEIVQVEARSRRSWAVVGVPLTIKPSHQTLQLVSQNANLFREAAEKKGFEQSASASGYHIVKEVPPASRKGSPLFGSDLFVDWIFQSSKGDVSEAFHMDRQHTIIVAQMTEILPAGPKPLDDVKGQIQQQIQLKKEVALLAPRAQQVRAAVGPNGDLSTVATTLGDPRLAPITAVMGPNESVNGLPTSEYVVNDWAYSAQPGSISPPLQGDHGYYIAKLMGRSVPTYQQFQAVRTNIMKQLLQEKQQRMLMDWINNQKEHATIVDYRVRQR